MLWYAAMSDASRHVYSTAIRYHRRTQHCHILFPFAGYEDVCVEAIV